MGYVRHIPTLDVDWNGFGALRIKLVVVSLLAFPEPAGLDQPDPTIVAKDSRYEGFHLLRDLLVGDLILLDTLKNAILPINLCSQLAGVVIFGVESELGFYPDGPVKLSFDLANLHILF